jgi:hypothetical protein
MFGSGANARFAAATSPLREPRRSGAARVPAVLRGASEHNQPRLPLCCGARARRHRVEARQVAAVVPSSPWLAALPGQVPPQAEAAPESLGSISSLKCANESEHRDHDAH